LRKLPDTKIAIIDDYYKGLNQNEEVERVSYINEYRRLIEQVTQMWRRYKPYIPDSEPLYVNQLLEREVYQMNNYDPALLYKLSQYIIMLQNFIKALTRAKNLAEERESKLNTLLKIMTHSDLPELEEKGIPLML